MVTKISVVKERMGMNTHEGWQSLYKVRTKIGVAAMNCHSHNKLNIDGCTTASSPKGVGSVDCIALNGYLGVPDIGGQPGFRERNKM